MTSVTTVIEEKELQILISKLADCDESRVAGW